MNFDHNLYCTKIERHTTQLQSIIAMEECAEFIQVIRLGDTELDLFNKKNYLEKEVADVLITTERLKIIYDILDGNIQYLISIKDKRERNKEGLT